MNHCFQNIQISSVAACVPGNILNLRSLNDTFEAVDIEKVILATGIQSVRVAPTNVTSSDLCEKAARAVISHEKIDTKDIHALIFVSQTPDYVLPQTSHVLQQKLGLSIDTYCFDLRVGCSGYINALFQACLLINSGCAENVLLLVGDTTTRLVNDRDRASRMVFGDAGSATLVKKGDTEVNFSIHSDGAGYDKLIVPAGGFRTPAVSDSCVAKEQEEGNWRADNNLYMDGIGIFNFALSKIPPLITELLDNAGWSKEETDLFALHQANKFVVDFIRKRTKLKEEQVPVTVDGYGNTGPASIPLLLSECGNYLKEQKSLKKVVLVGFGVGLSWGGVTCSLENTSFLKPIIYE